MYPSKNFLGKWISFDFQSILISKEAIIVCLVATIFHTSEIDGCLSALVMTNNTNI